MAKDVLSVTEREIKSKSYLKGLRKEGKVPAVYYMHGHKPVSISLDAHIFAMMLSNNVNLFNLDFGRGRNKQSIIKEIQFDPISDEVIHVDLMGVKATEKIVIKVPINLIGTAQGVKDQGGILEHLIRELEVECLPKDMVTGIDVDISHLGMNDNFPAKDVPLENMVLITDENTVIARVFPPKVQAEEIEAEEGEEAAAEPELITAKEEEEKQEE
ncbi:MAG TPA: 50S ribosomal protein L25 [Bacteroidetes bacterium]|nr:50S ribosomal protein L25 [Bacteroidota bacterium]